MAGMLRELLKDAKGMGRGFAAGVLSDVLTSGTPISVEAAHLGMRRLLTADGSHIADPHLHRALICAQCRAVVDVCDGVLIARGAAANPGATAAKILTVFCPTAEGRCRRDSAVQTLLRLRTRCRSICEWSLAASDTRLKRHTIVAPDAAPVLASPREEVAAWLRLIATEAMLGVLRRASAPADLPADFVEAHEEQWFDFFRIALRNEVTGNAAAKARWDAGFVEPMAVAAGMTAVELHDMLNKRSAIDEKLQQMHEVLERLQSACELLSAKQEKPGLPDDLEEWLRLHQELQFHWQQQAEHDVVHAAAIRILLQLHWQQQAEHDREIRRQNATDDQGGFDALLKRCSAHLSVEARRLAGILGVLPAGIALVDLEALLGETAYAAAAELKSCGIVRVDAEMAEQAAAESGARIDASPVPPEMARLTQFVEVREYCAAHHPVSAEDRRAVEDHYVGLVMALADQVKRPGGEAAMRRLQAEVENIEVLLLAALSNRPEAEAEGVIRAACRWACFVAASSAGTSRITETAAAMAKSQGNIGLQAQCVSQVADIALARSDHDQAQRLYEEARELFETAGELQGQGRCLQRLGDVTRAQSDDAAARHWYQMAQLIYRQIGDKRGLVIGCKSLASIAQAHSDHAEAYRLYLDALPLYEQLGDVPGQADCTFGLGDIALERNELDEARRRYREALPLFVQSGDVLGQANCIKSLGKAALRNAEYEEAERYYQQAYPLFVQVGFVPGQANCLRGQGDIALARLNQAAARRFFSEALVLFERTKSVLDQANCLWKLGDLAREAQEPAEARQLWEKALAMFEQVGELWSQGMMHRRLASHAPNKKQRDAHAAAARKCWKGGHMYDLVAGLNEEFGAEAE